MCPAPVHLLNSSTSSLRLVTRADSMMAQGVPPPKDEMVRDSVRGVTTPRGLARNGCWLGLSAPAPVAAMAG